jgi:hypothetical protein
LEAAPQPRLVIQSLYPKKAVSELNNKIGIVDGLNGFGEATEFLVLKKLLEIVRSKGVGQQASSSEGIVTVVLRAVSTIFP